MSVRPFKSVLGFTFQSLKSQVLWDSKLFNLGIMAFVMSHTLNLQHRASGEKKRRLLLCHRVIASEFPDFRKLFYYLTRTYPNFKHLYPILSFTSTVWEEGICYLLCNRRELNVFDLGSGSNLRIVGFMNEKAGGSLNQT